MFPIIHYPLHSNAFATCQTLGLLISSDLNLDGSHDPSNTLICFAVPTEIDLV